MCSICEGASEEDVVARMRSRIDRFGFTIQAVEAPVPWAYTIGLHPGAGHPELVVVGECPACSEALLTPLAERALAGERFGPERPAFIRDGLAWFTQVHPAQYEAGLFDSWIRDDRARGVEPAPRPALQVLPPGSTWGASGLPALFRLDGERAFLNGAANNPPHAGRHRPSRAARRAARYRPR
jgi:hypothetical protein